MSFARKWHIVYVNTCRNAVSHTTTKKSEQNERKKKKRRKKRLHTSLEKESFTFRQNISKQTLNFSLKWIMRAASIVVRSPHYYEPSGLCNWRRTRVNVQLPFSVQNNTKLDWNLWWRMKRGLEMMRNDGNIDDARCEFMFFNSHYSDVYDKQCLSTRWRMPKIALVNISRNSFNSSECGACLCIPK